MVLNRSFLFLVILISLSFDLQSQQSCEKYSDEYIPKDLLDAISYLDCVWSDSSKVAFKSKPENEAVSMLHFGTGLYIRNNWGLWEGKNQLYNSFRSQGIFHPDDISSIILTSFHRKLNEIEINLDEQIWEYKKYWEEIQKENDSIKAVNKLEYKQYNVGDSVRMEFSFADKKDYAHLYNLGDYELKLARNTCTVQGVVKKKKGYKKDGYYLLIEILDICGYSNKIYYNSKKGHLEVGDKLPYNISLFNIEEE